MSSKNFVVDTTSSKDTQKRVSVRVPGSKGQLVLLLPRFSLVGPGDQVQIEAGLPQKFFVISAESKSDLIPVTPTFQHSGKVTLGAFQFDFDITEPNRTEDIRALQYLEQFHYKTFEPSPEDAESRRRPFDSQGGRKSVLLCYLKVEGAAVPAGYIELQMPLLMTKPRHDLFANPFTHPSRPVTWHAWDSDAIKKYVNLITRIARVVVAPDYRGLGLAKVLIETAKRFATERWHIGGRRALFLEISAEMLNYIDFVSSAGFTLVGRTEGNLERVVADLLQMRKGQKITSGIMTLQQKYLRAMEKYCDETGKEFDDVLRRLAEVTATEDPAASLSPAEWLAFRNVIRFPLPYYLCGLDDASNEYIVSNAQVSRASSRPRTRFKAKDTTLRLRDVRVVTRYRVPHTKYTRLIMDAFGIKGDLLQQTVCGPVNLEAAAGNIIFVSGPSGSGKSMLLRAADPDGIVEGDGLVRTMRGTQNYSVAWLKALKTEQPIFDYFAERYTPEATFAALSNVGLSEAFTFLKPYAFLSRGQRYRAMLADLLLRDEPVWIIDEFCSDLDPLTAKIVSHNLRRHVMRSGRICIVAAANHAHFIDVLRPTAVVVLGVGAEPKVITFREYKNEFLYKVV